MQTAARDREREDDRDRFSAEAIVVHRVFEAVRAVRQRGDGRPRQALAVVQQRLPRAPEPGEAEPQRQRAQPLGADPLRGDLGVKVASALVRGPHVAQHERQRLLDEHARAIEPHRRDHEAFLDQLRGDGHRSGRDPPDVRLVGPARHEADRPGAPPARALRLGEDGRDHRHVGQVRAAEIGVVQDRDVARGPGGERLHRAHRLRHRAEVHRDMGGLRQQSALGVEDRAGVVLALLDVGRERGVAQRRAHLFGRGGDERVEDREPRRIGRVARRHR